MSEYNSYDKAYLVKYAKKVLVDWDKQDPGNDITNAFGVGEVNLTLLTEEVVYDLDLDPAVLDDETHDVWEASAEAGEWFENEYTGEDLL